MLDGPELIGVEVWGRYEYAPSRYVSSRADACL
jgi:hypothetical protein